MEPRKKINPQPNTETGSSGAVRWKIDKVIGVTSSKGGVGRSFISGLLAMELNRKGFKVGILDANFNGSSIPMMFGLSGPVGMGEYSFIPLLTNSAIKILSPNQLVDDEKNPVIWKEALSGKVIESLYREVEWGPLDYLVVNLPVATSETAVTILRTIPFNAILFVNQPQHISSRLNDKGIRIVREFNQNILGLVENMSCHLDPGTGKTTPLFGAASTELLAGRHELPILARIPFIAENAILVDSGKMEQVSLEDGVEFVDNFSAALFEMETRQLEQAESIQNLPLTTEPGLDRNDDMAAESLQDTTETDPLFSDIVLHLIRNRYNMGKLDQPDAQGLFLGVCGDRMQIDLKIVDNRIMDAKFTADGCGATLACGSMLTRMATSKTLQEAGKIHPSQLIDALGGLPDDHLHCAELAVMTLREALIDASEGHRNKA